MAPLSSGTDPLHQFYHVAPDASVRAMAPMKAAPFQEAARVYRRPHASKKRFS